MAHDDRRQPAACAAVVAMHVAAADPAGRGCESATRPSAGRGSGICTRSSFLYSERTSAFMAAPGFQIQVPDHDKCCLYEQDVSNRAVPYSVTVLP